MSKTDLKLGLEVHEHLISLGIETPMVGTFKATDSVVNEIATHMRQIMQILKLDVEDDSLCETPERVGKMFAREIFSGLDYSNFPKCTTVENKFSGKDDFVLEKGITLYSDCEHHIRPIIGSAAIAYIPKDRVLGLSKLNRIAQFFARRPQVQERLTQQIAAAISYVTGSDDVVVLIDAKHLCVSQRGVKDTNSSTITMKAMGRFETEPTLRNEFTAGAK